MAFSFDQIFAADPSNPSNVAQNASITIFAPGDTGMTPLTITDPDGQPLNNPLPVNANGFGSAFAHATLDRVAWAGGGFTGFFTSYEGMKNEAVAAKEAAEAAAVTAGADAAAVATAAIGTATDEANSAAVSAATSASEAAAAATAAADAAALVGAPADTAIAAAISGTGATKTAIDARIASKGADHFTPRPLNAVVGALGDSITRNGNNPATTTTGRTHDGRSYLLWAVTLSNGALRMGPTAATGGFTSQQIKDTHLPTILAERPAYCIVHAGTNDIAGGTPAATTRANLTSIWTQLAAAGITPILTTLMSRSTYTGTSAFGKSTKVMNAWINAQAVANGWPLVDFYTATVDPVLGGLVTSYFGDGIHPNTAGAKALGKAIANVTTRLVAGPGRIPPYLAATNTWPNMTNAGESNALFINHTGGLPTGWELLGGTTAATSTTVTPMTADEGIGNWFNFTAASAGSGYRTTGLMPTVVGHKLALGFKIKTSGLNVSNPKLSIALAYGKQLFWWGDDIYENFDTVSTIYSEFVVPPAYNSASHYFQIWAIGGAATVSIGQFTCMDLTDLGLA